MAITCAWRMPNVGVDYRAKVFLYNLGLAGAGLQVGLFTNNRVFACTNVLADYTECVLGGYARKTLAGGTWARGTLSACVVQYSYPVQQWVFTDGGAGTTSLYGAFLYSPDSLEIVAAGLFFDGLTQNPFLVPSAGGIFQSDFLWTDQNCS